MSYHLSKRSKQKLNGVHDDLSRVVRRAIELTDVDFVVLEGVRTLERQRELYRIGATRIIKSRHLTGHAVDLGAWVDHQVQWHWPLYHRIAKAMKQAARECQVAIVWGGDWSRFKDGPHFELSRDRYP